MQLLINEITPNWKPFQKSLIPLQGEKPCVHIFMLPLTDLVNDTAYLTSLLSTEEQARAKRYIRVEDSKRFIICRAILKLLLSQITNRPIKDIVIQKTANHKPYVAATDFKFNVTHTTTYGLIAISKSEVGIDVEFIDESYDYQSVLNRVFKGEDLNEIQESSTPLSTFFKFWTRKEAIVKATGKGIDDSMVTIPVKNGNHRTDNIFISEQIKKLCVNSFKVGNNHVGSMAYASFRGKEPTISESIINDLTVLKVD